MTVEQIVRRIIEISRFKRNDIGNISSVDSILRHHRLMINRNSSKKSNYKSICPHETYEPSYFDNRTPKSLQRALHGPLHAFLSLHH